MQDKRKNEVQSLPCNSVATHSKVIAHGNRAPLVLSIKYALISRTSINSWKQNVTLLFQGGDGVSPQASTWTTFQFFLMVIF